MLSLFITVSYRYFRLRWSRAVLIVLSIMLGVTLLTATRVLIRSMLQASSDTLNPFAQAADLIIMNGETGVPGGMVDELDRANISGVARIEPLVIGDGRLPSAREHSQRIKLIGVRIDLPNTLAELKESKKNKIEIELDKQSKVEVLPGLVAEGTTAEKTWETISVEYFDNVLNPFKVKKKRIPVFVGQDLAGRLIAQRTSLEEGGIAELFSFAVLDRTHELWVAGTVASSGDSVALSGSAVLMLLGDASSVFYTDPGRSEFVTRIHLMYHPDADRAAVRDRVDKIIAGRAQVVTPEENDLSIQDVTATLEVAFTLAGYLALLVGLFLVYISLTVSVAERRQDIGIMRSLGATRVQIAGLFAGEAVVLGVIGSVLGIPVGWGLAGIAIGPIQKVMSDLFVSVDPRTLSLPWSVVVLAMLSGVVTSLLAALAPALQAAQEEPAEAVRRVSTSGNKLFRNLYIASCVALIIVGFAALLLRHRLPDRTGGFGGIICLMLGTMAATPLLTRFLGYVVRPPATLVLGLYGRLAADNLARSSGRTGLVVAVLAAGVALIVETSGLQLGTEVALLGWIEDRIVADLFVTSNAPLTSGGLTLPMSEARGKEIAEDPELKDKIEEVVAFRFHVVDFRRKIVVVIAFDADKAHAAHQTRNNAVGAELYPRLGRMRFQLTDQSFAELRDRIPEKTLSKLDPLRDRIFASREEFRLELSRLLTRKEYEQADYHLCSHAHAAMIQVLVSDNFIAQYNVKVGDEIRVLGRKGRPVRLLIIGNIVDYTWNRGTILMDREVFKDEFGATQVDLFHIYVKQGPDHERDVQYVRDVLRARGKDHDRHVLSRPEFREGLRDVLRDLYRISYAQLLIVSLVVSLGIVAALLISVLQRRRELGLMRAVGASRGQVVMSVLAEALLMGFFGAVLGLLVGIPLHWVALRVLLLEETGFIFPFVIPWRESGVVVATALGVAGIAGLLPALRAMKLRISDALAYE